MRHRLVWIVCILGLVIFFLHYVEAAPLAKVFTAKGKTFSVYPIEMGKTGQSNCRNYYGKCALLTTDEPVMTIANFDYQVTNNDKPGFIISLSKTEQRTIREVSKVFLGKQLAIVYEGVILHAPKVKAVIDTDRLKMTFCNRRNFSIVQKSLRGELKTDLKESFECGCARDE